MHKLSSLLAVTLLLMSSSVWSATGSSNDLTYCLELKSNLEIAKCSGEVASGKRKKPHPREQVEHQSPQKEKTAPANKIEAPVRPAATGENAGMDPMPVLSKEKTIAPASTGETPVPPTATGENVGMDPTPVLSKEKPIAPESTGEAPVQPAATGENAGMDPTPILPEENTIAPASTGEVPVQPAATDKKTPPSISDEEAVQRATTSDKPAKDATPEY